MDLQHFGGLLWLLREGHMVHFAGVGHSIITSVHVQLQGALHRERLPTCIHLFVTFNERSARHGDRSLILGGCDGHAAECVTAGVSRASLRFLLSIVRVSCFFLETVYSEI